MGHYKNLPLDGKEVTRWANRDAAFEDIVNGLRRLVVEAKAEEQQQTKPPPDPRIVQKLRASVKGRKQGKPRAVKQPAVLPRDRLGPAVPTSKAKAAASQKTMPAKAVGKSPAERARRRKG